MSMPKVGKKHYLCDNHYQLIAMKPAILLLTILVVGGAIVWVIDRLFYRHHDDEPADESDLTQVATRQGCTDESCGLRTICPSEQILAGECRQDITYYDDEELDRFAGRDAHSYSPEEEELWRDVLYTLLPADLLGWGQSIKHRGLKMPVAIREEFLQLAREVKG